MCRLFGQRSEPDLGLHEPLCSSHNALRVQSHQHPHGWGIGWYERGVPRVRRGLMPAHADAAFARAAHRARSRIVVAHVRDASVGPISIENTHPFVHRGWLFAHNGTVARFRASGRVRRAIEDRIDPTLRAAIGGETDSERCFHLFLTHLSRRLGRRRRANLEDVRAAMAFTVREVAAIADVPGGKRSTLNFLVSDGRLLAACRHGKPLCMALGAEGGRVFALASEPIGGEDWEEVPDGGFAGLDAGHRLLARALLPAPRKRGAPGGPGSRRAAPPARRAARRSR